MQKNIKNHGVAEAEKRKRVQSNFHMEAVRSFNGISISIYGVYSVLDFNEENVLIKLRKGKIKITGKGLKMSVYENSTIEIAGQISEVAFL